MPSIMEYGGTPYIGMAALRWYFCDTFWRFRTATTSLWLTSIIMRLPVKALFRSTVTPCTAHFQLLWFLTKSFVKLEQTHPLVHSGNCSYDWEMAMFPMMTGKPYWNVHHHMQTTCMSLTMAYTYFMADKVLQNSTLINYPNSAHLLRPLMQSIQVL